MLEGWIDINQFAEKYGVSVSTLRRRIRTQSVDFKLEKGRYLLPDNQETLGSAPLFSRQLPKLKNSQVQSQSVAPRQVTAPVLHDPVRDFLASDEVLPVVLAADLEALKKDNRKLRQQLAELETYIKALEAEVDK